MKDLRPAYFLLLFIIQATVFGQDSTDTSSFKWKTVGFVKSDYWYDTRATVNAREGLFSLYPVAPEKDPNGIDPHASDRFNFSVITTRLNLTLSSSDIMKAKTTAFIEADFSGISNVDINGFRLRHAYIYLDWKRVSVLMGQYWHPLFTPGVVPTVISLNTGAPFQQFNRSPQLRIDYRIDDTYTIVFAAISQRDYVNDGPAGQSPAYLHQSSIPNIHLQWQYGKKNITLGIAGDYKNIRPEITTAQGFTNLNTLNSFAGSIFFKHTYNKWQFKTKATIGQNMTEQLMMGGYAVSSLDSVTGIAAYTPTNNFAGWVNLTYGDRVCYGLFGGYTKNLGTSQSNTGIYYGRGSDVDVVYRVSPHISVITGNIRFSFELEYTNASFGTPDSEGIIINPTGVANLRGLFTAIYFFNI